MKKKQAFPDKQKLREYLTTRPVLQERLNVVTQDEMKGY